MDIRPQNSLQKIGNNIFTSISKHKSPLYLFVSTLTHFHVAGVKQAFKATIVQNAEACDMCRDEFLRLLLNHDIDTL